MMTTQSTTTTTTTSTSTNTSKSDLHQPTTLSENSINVESESKCEASSIAVAQTPSTSAHVGIYSALSTDIATSTTARSITTPWGRRRSGTTTLLLWRRRWPKFRNYTIIRRVGQSQ